MNITLNIDQITFDDFGEVGYMTAMWAHPKPEEFRGCPMGRGYDKDSALRDLISRTEMESKVKIEVVTS